MITIRHTHADGTLLEGSRKGDDVFELLRGLRDNWRYFPSIRAIGIGQSRDRNADAYKIRRAAEALRAAGHEVTVSVDESERRTFAEAEAERNDRAADRAERMAGYAANAAARSDDAWQRSHQIADSIPFGQPVLVGHHSERRHRRDLDRIHNLQGKSIEERGKAEHYEHRAASAGNYQASRENVPTTLRRIKALEARERSLRSALVGRQEYYEDSPGEWRARLIRPTEADAGRWKSDLADVQDELAYWRGVIAAAEAAGVKVWSRADFAKGDFAQWQGRTWFEVLRVNAKSVTIPALIAGATRRVLRKSDTDLSWTDTLPYDKVTGRKSADEMAELLAAS